MTDGQDARDLWTLVEPIHAAVYFAPDARDRYQAVGIKGGWMGYFASRAAAMGPVAPAVVAATFYGFAPRMVARAIPDAWSFSTPQAVLDARLAIARDAVAPSVAAAGEEVVADAVALLRRVVDAADVGGRPLAAAHAALPTPDDPVLALWHGCTVLREHRGDAHVAALVAAGLAPCEAHVLQVARGVVPRELIQSNRGWTDEEWEDAVEHLTQRGWLTPDVLLTDAGRTARDDVEASTDRAAARPLAVLGTDERTRLRDDLAAVVSGLEGRLPYPNPIGLVPPAAAG